MPLAPANRARWHALLACVGTLVLWWRFPGPATVSLLALALSLALLSWISPRSYAPVQRGFDAVIRALLATITWCLLGLVYFGLFTPLRLWRTLRRTDPLQLRRSQRQPATYLEPLARHRTNFDRQF